MDLNECDGGQRPNPSRAGDGCSSKEDGLFLKMSRMSELGQT